MPDTSELVEAIRACRLCADRFRRTASAHEPRPVVRVSPRARILVAGQAPGARVHASGKPFTDPSGDRLRDWMGIDEARFYDRGSIAILPMAFCFPGTSGQGADLPPPPVCARTWRAPLLAGLTGLRLTLLVGGHAQKWHLGGRRSVTETVRDWRRSDPSIIPLPHPSWRNSAWLRRNPWFESDLLPMLRRRVKQVLDET